MDVLLLKMRQGILQNQNVSGRACKQTLCLLVEKPKLAGRGNSFPHAIQNTQDLQILYFLYFKIFWNQALQFF